MMPCVAGPNLAMSRADNRTALLTIYLPLNTCAGPTGGGDFAGEIGELQAIYRPEHGPRRVQIGQGRPFLKRAGT